MAQTLRALATLAEDLASVPSTYMAAHSHLYLQLQGIGAMAPQLRAHAALAEDLSLDPNTYIG